MPKVREAARLRRNKRAGVLTGEYPLASKQRGDLVLPGSKLGSRGTLKPRMPPARKEEG